MNNVGQFLFLTSYNNLDQIFMIQLKYFKFTNGRKKKYNLLKACIN